MCFSLLTILSVAIFLSGSTALQNDIGFLLYILDLIYTHREENLAAQCEGKKIAE